MQALDTSRAPVSAPPDAPPLAPMFTLNLDVIRAHMDLLQLDEEHLSFLQGGGHGGSHPHLAHNFLMAVLGEKPALPDAATSANWTMVGICAHQSAMKGGERVVLPTF